MERVVLIVKEIKGTCPLYKINDQISVNGYYIESSKSSDVCLHALSATLTLLSAFSHGASAKSLGIGTEKKEGYIQCPDPGPPYTCGGTVIFKIKKE